MAEDNFDSSKSDFMDELMALKADIKGRHARDFAGLRTWKADMKRQIHKLDRMSEALKKRANELRAKVEAVDVVLSRPESHDTAPHQEHDSSEGTAFTPVDKYWPPILESLVELGGRGSRQDVIQRVGKKLAPILTTGDKAMLPSGNAVCWQNRVVWQRLNMVTQGLLRSDSPRGIWEITETGKKFLELATSVTAF